MTDESVKEVDLYGGDGPGQARRRDEDEQGSAASRRVPKEGMREKLRTEACRTMCKMRKAILEPFFGQIKEERGFRRFSVRGKANVSREWKLVCAVCNMLKPFRAGWVLEME